MSRCKHCIHWRIEPHNKDYRIEPIDPDTQAVMVMPFEVRACHSPKLLEFERPIEDSGASVMDGSDYCAELYTAENFGCVNFEDRP
jgi:hypothetical protein